MKLAAHRRVSPRRKFFAPRLIVAVAIWLTGPGEVGSATPGPDQFLRLVLGAGQNRSLHIPGITKAAIGSSKIARVRALPPDSLLVTALSAGTTTLQVWKSDGSEETHWIEVLPPALHESFHNPEGQGVIQVALEFLELDSALSESLGIRWPEAVHFASAGALQGATQMSGLNYSASFQSAPAWIALLCRKGWARVLARPELYVRLGEEAQFHSGGEFPVPSSVESYGGYQRRVEWKPYGLTVKVRPQSGDRYLIRSDIRVEISEIDGAAAVNGIPAITRRQLDTKMESLEGETVILSGLVRQARAAGRESVPLLGDIPLLGDLLFSQTTESSRSTEILMAVTFSVSTAAKARERIRKWEEKK